MNKLMVVLLSLISLGVAAKSYDEHFEVIGKALRCDRAEEIATSRAMLNCKSKGYVRCKDLGVAQLGRSIDSNLCQVKAVIVGQPSRFTESSLIELIDSEDQLNCTKAKYKILIEQAIAKAMTTCHYTYDNCKLVSKVGVYSGAGYDGFYCTAKATVIPVH